MAVYPDIHYRQLFSALCLHIASHHEYAAQSLSAGVQSHPGPWHRSTRQRFSAGEIPLFQNLPFALYVRLSVGYLSFTTTYVILQHGQIAHRHTTFETDTSTAKM